MQLKELRYITRFDNLYKNLLILIPYCILSELKIDFSLLINFVTLCLLSSICYMLNDIIDAARDRLLLHKRNTPLQRGAVTIKDLVVLISLFIGSMIGLQFLNLSPKNVLLNSVIFLISSVIYSKWGKKVVLVDIVLLSINYTIRTFFAINLLGSIDYVIPAIFLFISLQASFRLANIRKFSHLGNKKLKSLAYSADDGNFLQSVFSFSLFLGIAISTHFETIKILWTLPVIGVAFWYNYISSHVNFETNLNKDFRVVILFTVLYGVAYLIGKNFFAF